MGDCDGNHPFFVCIQDGFGWNKVQYNVAHYSDWGPLMLLFEGTSLG
ncbi:hypothetical protein [Lactiplantibacillus plantarum]|jgi:hypothetical protein|uniref:Uncharacterized protein n=2 Tax=Lactiplantibacillus plantarum TaxID=1590 RepID=A0AAP1ELU8_LACPN|nr:hypothetical protein [Lactiplantibacillus plantarum]ADN97514.1 hypothetical protein LPST_C0290 [Lactiplantibacillus plantarum ST-III]ERO40467.1 hypothetical protein LPLWJ_24190 [Lactiplantibacillus plantarum WJL]KPN43626.1 hypothetical protein WJL_0699 [Lactiplantibacillus plantarum WJL]KPN86739.1 hypothetical protein Nizo2877_0597 [Lactiplantibacillus plantarum]KZT78285.1 hypothetical protein Nizo1838_2446 [Lactiplantibacillus plantarum]